MIIEQSRLLCGILKNKQRRFNFLRMYLLKLLGSASDCVGCAV
jgi:hypothetical protein